MSNAVLGIDTSNYTTSAAYFDTDSFEVKQSKKLLPVKKGEKGIRQSDAVFHHTVQLPIMLEGLGDIKDICAVGVSDRPSCRKDSYMPCFLVGLGLAKGISYAKNIPYYSTTHQAGHILAALYSADKLDLVRGDESFLSFHVSGGTTDMLLVTPCGIDDGLLSIERIGGSNDLKAGQLIDRCGVMLGLDFPCGIELEKLAFSCDEKFRHKISVKNGECSLSGYENKLKKLYDEGAEPSYIAKYCLSAVGTAVHELTRYSLSELGRDTSVVYAGGVMSDKIIADMLSEDFDAYFAEPQFSCDNAVGVAVYSAFMKGLI